MHNLTVKIRDGNIDHCKIYTYPDGQRNVVLDMTYFNNPKYIIYISCQIKTFYDFELLHCLVTALRKNDFYIEKLDFKYLLGMRSDRSFELGMPNYFRDVISPQINMLNIPRIYILGGHSKLNALNNCEFYSLDLAFNGLKIAADESEFNRDKNREYMGFFHKERMDDNIKISLNSQYSDFINKSDEWMPILICDDLCDGGKTFIEIAKFMKSNFPARKLFLYVIHGIFSKGFSELLEYYEYIFTTNSYQDIDHPLVECIKVWSRQ